MKKITRDSLCYLGGESNWVTTWDCFGKQTASASFDATFPHMTLSLRAGIQGQVITQTGYIFSSSTRERERLAEASWTVDFHSFSVTLLSVLGEFLVVDSQLWHWKYNPPGMAFLSMFNPNSFNGLSSLFSKEHPTSFYLLILNNWCFLVPGICKGLQRNKFWTLKSVCGFVFLLQPQLIYPFLHPHPCLRDAEEHSDV